MHLSPPDRRNHVTDLIAAGKTALLRLWSFGTNEAEVAAHYLVEP